MGLLGAFLATVHAGLLRQVAITELFLNKLATAGYGILAQVGRVCTHVGDVARLVQALGQHHGFLDTEAHAVARRLLQCRGNKGSRGP